MVEGAFITGSGAAIGSTSGTRWAKPRPHTAQDARASPQAHRCGRRVVGVPDSWDPYYISTRDLQEVRLTCSAQ